VTKISVQKRPTGEFSYLRQLIICIGANKGLYVMILPVLAFYIVFCYTPMYGVIIAFKNFQPGLGMWGSPWVGIQNFVDFFTGPYFKRVLSNTVVISLSSIIFGFPAPIILALMLNEVKSSAYKRLVQTITYIPHFISLVVVCGIILQFTNSSGVITVLLNKFFGVPLKNMMGVPSNFVPIYVISSIWQEIGWGSIVYLSAITTIDTQIYEASEIDGANIFMQMWHVTLPGIMPVIMVMLILRLGNVMTVGFEKIILLYNPAIYSTSDVISSFTYRQGLQDFNWSFSTAVGLFNSVINYVFLISSNYLSRRLNENSLW
jgi:putative aldouronate transport system permease protein